MIYPRMYNKNQVDDIRNKRLNIEGSSLTPVTISDINASSQMIYGFSDDSDLRKYLPLNHFRIVNNGGTDLKIIIGNNPSVGGVKVLNDLIWTYEGNFNNFIIENLDTSNTADGSEIYVEVQRKPRGF